MRPREQTVACPPNSRSPTPCQPGGGPRTGRRSARPGGTAHRPSYGRRWRQDSAGGLLFPHPMSEWTSIVLLDRFDGQRERARRHADGYLVALLLADEGTADGG